MRHQDRAQISRRQWQPERYRLITFEGAFHGRTLATIAAGGNPKYLEGFGPPAPGFDQVPFADLAAVEAAITEETAGVLLEPVQGEGGLRVFPPAFLVGAARALRRAGPASRRSTRFSAASAARASSSPANTPASRLTSSRSPRGSAAASRSAPALRPTTAAKGMTVGAHGSTFGGNPLATAVGGAVLDVVLAEGFLDRVAALGALSAPAARRTPGPHIRRSSRRARRGADVRRQDAHAERRFAAAARAEGLLTVLAGDNVVRLLPPLIIDESHIAEATTRLDARLRASFARRRGAERLGAA